MLGFLSVSTELPDDLSSFDVVFQSRAGFSECLDPTGNIYRLDVEMFQSRAGFSECLDTEPRYRTAPRRPSFNPVLGFLSVSTSAGRVGGKPPLRFNPVLGFLSVSTGQWKSSEVSEFVSIPCWVF